MPNRTDTGSGETAKSTTGHSTAESTESGPDGSALESTTFGIHRAAESTECTHAKGTDAGTGEGGASNSLSQVATGTFHVIGGAPHTSEVSVGTATYSAESTSERTSEEGPIPCAASTEGTHAGTEGSADTTATEGTESTAADTAS